jgi:hypothetical protein
VYGGGLGGGGVGLGGGGVCGEYTCRALRIGPRIQEAATQARAFCCLFRAIRRHI